MKIQKIIRVWCVFFSAILLLQSFMLNAFADQEYHWFCKHEKNHVQPVADSSLSFIKECGGYYVDQKHSSMDETDKVIYLTFDAGYENGNVEKILDVLKEENVTGAFFILKHLITANPDLVLRMAEEGHFVCNHTCKHKNMAQCNEEELMNELTALESAYYDLCGKEMKKYYRPPEGTFSKANLSDAKENGYKTVFWSFGYPDWDNNRQMPVEKAKSIVLENIHNGEVMLLHPTSATNAAILQDVIRELKSQGFRFGTLDELCEI